MLYFPTHLHSHFSLLDGISQTKQIVDRCKELGLSGCAITDHGTLSGCVTFYKDMIKAKLKPILGVELNLTFRSSLIKEPDNRKYAHLILLAKNLKGWQQLIRIVSESHTAENYYYKPRIDFEQLKEMCNGKNIIGLSGHIGSTLAYTIFNNPPIAFAATTYEEAKLDIRDDWEERLICAVKQHQELFGVENFFLEIQLYDKELSPCQEVLAKALRHISKKTLARCVANHDAHYCKQQHAEDQRVMLARKLQTNLANVEKKLYDSENFPLAAFFRSNNFYILSPLQMEALHTQEELQCSLDIASMCEGYDIITKPYVPIFECPDTYNPDTYLRQLCRDGWEVKIKQIVEGNEELKNIYAERVKYELLVLQDAGLSSYFLIVRDILEFCRSNKWLVGAARGSSAGCLVSYLIDVTAIDPIKYKLVFERFWNPARSKSMPDIDLDIPMTKREQVIDYIKNKYGTDCVAQMVSFQTTAGRGALKTVLTANSNLSFEEQNEITQWIEDKAKISGDLQEMEEETGSSSVILWALQHKKELQKYCTINEDGTLEGPLSKKFEQAIRLEKTKLSQSKHASGIVVAPKPLKEICPMVYDSETKSQIVGVEKQEAEDLGMLKLDILGITTLDKLQAVSELLKTGDITNE